MRLEEWDRLELELAQLVVEESIPMAAAISSVCRNNKKCCAKSLLLAAISFAAHLDEFFGSDAPEGAALSLERYKVIVGLAADVATLSQKTQYCEDLQSHWTRTADDVFVGYLL